MPEAVNRLLTDQLAELPWALRREAGGNLAREGIHPDKIHMVGILMVDSQVAKCRCWGMVRPPGA